MRNVKPSASKPNWLDWFTYKLFWNRWNPIFQSDANLRTAFVRNIIAYDSDTDRERLYPIRVSVRLPKLNATILVFVNSDPKHAWWGIGSLRHEGHQHIWCAFNHQAQQQELHSFGGITQWLPLPE